MRLFGLIAFVAVFVSSDVANAMGGDSYQDLIKNEDGTVTLVAPYHAPEGKTYVVGISEKSDMSGVCKHYGFGPAGLVVYDFSEEDYMAVINADGVVETYYGHDNPEKNIRIAEITCEDVKKKRRRRR